VGTIASEITSADGVKILLHIRHGNKPEERFWKPDLGERKKCLI
jgi:hypothetical protein